MRTYWFYVLCLLFTTTILQAQTTKKVLLEDLTGAWCGLCPAGSISFNEVLANYDNVVGVGVHIGDAMEIPSTAEIGNVYSGGGVNVFLIDRYTFDDMNVMPINFHYETIAAKLNERLAMPAQVGLSFDELQYDAATRNVTVSLQANFYDSFIDSDLRFNLWIVEDSIQGYNQVNYFNTDNGHLYYEAGNPIENFVHRRVLRKALGGNWGTEGSIATNVINNGDTFIHTYTFTVDETWDITQLSLVGLVQVYKADDQERHILNVETLDVLPNTGNLLTHNQFVLPDNSTRLALSVIPNPTEGPVNIEITTDKVMPVLLTLNALDGRLVEIVKQGNLMAGTHRFTTLLPKQEGVYFVRFLTNEGVLVKKIMCTAN